MWPLFTLCSEMAITMEEKDKFPVTKKEFHSREINLKQMKKNAL